MEDINSLNKGITLFVNTFLRCDKVESMYRKIYRDLYLCIWKLGFLWLSIVIYGDDILVDRNDVTLMYIRKHIIILLELPE